MNRTRIVAALLALGLTTGLAACGNTPEQAADSAPAATTATTATVSPFGTDDFTIKRKRGMVEEVITTAEERGATPDQIVAVLVAGKAETNWRSGLPTLTGSNIRDAYGWNFTHDAGADSGKAMALATDRFFDVADTVELDASDPVAYALAVQRADPRGYQEDQHFQEGETAEMEYAAALESARAAYAELRPTP